MWGCNRRTRWCWNTCSVLNVGISVWRIDRLFTIHEAKVRTVEIYIRETEIRVAVGSIIPVTDSLVEGCSSSSSLRMTGATLCFPRIVKGRPVSLPRDIYFNNLRVNSQFLKSCAGKYQGTLPLGSLGLWPLRTLRKEKYRNGAGLSDLSRSKFPNPGDESWMKIGQKRVSYARLSDTA